MPSCLPGFEYDIFVSYRQKDNRLDGWVTTFVQNLKNELEVTFKESISVYFDENAHDGILETHEVRDSLNEKLKCIIFIPIVSQTYCDPDSYAWKNEFLVFKEFALKDRVGFKVRLSNGNIVNRILPVRIHELDSVDASLLASELGGTIRSVDFIYKAPGVNRPLQPAEIHPHQNQAKVFYRDQVNKVANHVKEIIHALRRSNVNSTAKSPEVISIQPARWKKSLQIIVSIAVLFLAGALFFIWATASQPGETKPLVSIAVLPFKLIGNDEESAAIADGIQEAIQRNLSQFPDLKVKARTHVERFRQASKSATEIARELKVDHLLEGSAQKIGNTIRITVRLMDEHADVIWSQHFDRKFEDVFIVLNQISQSVANSLKAKLTPEIAYQINRTPTQNFEAFDLYLRGKQASRRFIETHNLESLDLALDLLNHSIQLDSSFASCYGWLSGLYLIKRMDSLSSSKDYIVKLANRALAIDSSVVEANMALSELYFLLNDDVNSLRYTYEALEDVALDSISTMHLIDRLTSVYMRIGDSDQALYLLDELLKLDPLNQDVLHNKIITLAAEHQMNQLTALKNDLTNHMPTSGLIQLINFHQALESKNIDGIITVYQNIKTLEADKAKWFTQYGAIMAFGMREKKMNAEAELALDRLEGQLGDEPLYRAQIELYRGANQRALEFLANETVGWYNLNLSLVNPIMEVINQTEGFKNFIDRNKIKILNLRERVHQLELRGYLPKPDLALETVIE